MHNVQKAGYALLHGLLFIALVIMVSSCEREEYTQDELESAKTQFASRVFSETIFLPTDRERVIGVVGGEWIGTINNDPRSFNPIIAVDDPDSRTITNVLTDALVDYDVHTREWLPNLASYEIENDTENDKTVVTFTLRDDIYWTVPGQSLQQGVQVTADDVVFWYNDIVGNPQLQLSGYASQFVTMLDGSEARITVDKVDTFRFTFTYPRIVANPLLSSNMDFGPHYIFAPLLAEAGIEGVRNALTVDSDVLIIPSIGTHHIVEYSPGVRVVLARNPHYWKKDAQNTPYPYIERVILKIVPDVNAEFLLFKEGQKDSYTIRPEDLDELITGAGESYGVYNGGLTLGSALLGINQNPNALPPMKYNWFRHKQFRQAMSALLNRERIAQQVYRGLAEPALHLFAKPNPYFDEKISLQYRYDQRSAMKLLRKIDIKQDDAGIMRDSDGNAIEFDLIVGAENNVGVDIANVFADELRQVGITLNVKPTDFQKMVNSLLTTYEWDSAIFSLGVNYWPSQGSNVWPSSGNLHFWYPLQETPATEWEAQIDTLYNEGKFTSDKQEAKKIYDEYQRILLDELPIIYIVHQYSFLAVRNEWENVRYDTLNGLESNYLFLKQ